MCRQCGCRYSGVSYSSDRSNSPCLASFAISMSPPLSHGNEFRDSGEAEPSSSEPATLNILACRERDRGTAWSSTAMGAFWVVFQPPCLS